MKYDTIAQAPKSVSDLAPGDRLDIAAKAFPLVVGWPQRAGNGFYNVRTNQGWMRLAGTLPICPR